MEARRMGQLHKDAIRYVPSTAKSNTRFSPQLSTSSLWYFSLIKIVARRYPMACERRVAGGHELNRDADPGNGADRPRSWCVLTHRFANTSWVSSRSHDPLARSDMLRESPNKCLSRYSTGIGWDKICKVAPSYCFIYVCDRATAVRAWLQPGPANWEQTTFNGPSEQRHINACCWSWRLDNVVVLAARGLRALSA